MIDLESVKAGVNWETAPGDPMLDLGIEHGMTHYAGVGESALRIIASALSLGKAAYPKSVLDFACANGRVTRWLRSAFPQADLDVADVAVKQMRWTAKTFNATGWEPTMDLSQSIAPKKYDLIWCGSLATHISEEQTSALFEKFYSWLNPGGIAIITTHGRQFVQFAIEERLVYFHDPAEIKEILRQMVATGYGFRAHPGQEQGISGNTAAWAINAINRIGARLVLFGEHLWDDHQDVFAIQKAA